MGAEDITQAKILILHLVSDTPGLTYHMLMDKCLESLYMDYFSFARYYEELLSGGLLRRSSERDGAGVQLSEDLVYITDSGNAVLDDIKCAISKGTLRFLEEAKEDLAKAMNDHNRVSVKVEQGDNGSFIASLTINDDKGAAFTTSIRLDDHESASKTASVLRKKADSIERAVRDIISASKE